MALFPNNTINNAARISVGTTIAYATWTGFVQMPTMIPAKEVNLKFQKSLMPITEKLMKLTEQKIRLEQARGRLLPKLMHVEMEVYR